MTAGDVVVMLASALWTVAVGLTSYAAGVRRGMALAGLAEDDGETSTLDGWDWEGADQGEEGA